MTTLGDTENWYYNPGQTTMIDINPSKKDWMHDRKTCPHLWRRLSVPTTGGWPGICVLCGRRSR